MINENINITADDCNEVMYHYTKQIREYTILGDIFKTESFIDINLLNMIAILNVLGEPYWIELKKLNILFENDMKDFIENRLRVIKRENNIDSITSKNS